MSTLYSQRTRRFQSQHGRRLLVQPVWGDQHADHRELGQADV
ncbi:MAG: hypothetical protein WB623_01480 [Candidatus Sulfotelmatobacter sp.]|jgi:hypothetical protein